MVGGHSRVVAFAICWLLAGIQSSIANAQSDPFRGNPFDNIGGLDGKPSVDLLGSEDKVLASGGFTAATENSPALLFVTATVEDGWHIYSITQKPGGPVPSQIKLESSQSYRVIGDWQAIPAPEVHTNAEIESWKDIPLEEHAGTVTWQAPIELAPGVDPAQLQIKGAVYAQVCKTVCLLPKDFGFSVGLLEEPPVEAAPKTQVAVGEYRAENSHTLIQGQVHRTHDGRLQLNLTATPSPGYFLYALAEPDATKIGKPVLIRFTDIQGVEVGPPVADRAPIRKSSLPGMADDQIYKQAITWSSSLSAQGAESQPAKITGLIGYQACNDSRCDFLQAARFEVGLPLDSLKPGDSVPLSFTPAKYAEVEKLATASAAPATFDANNLILDNDGDRPVWYYLVGALLGGLILNLMPCVLPVVGLKILSFVEQAGHDRKRVLMLNFWYSLGLMSVFMILATLPVLWKLLYDEQFIWGRQFAYSGFNIVLASVVFAMALSLIGVWEIPIPGFIGSSKVNKIAAKEGISGAFSKGAITTVLATPCSGPFVGTALGWALQQPSYLIYGVFACVGLGMASPYLLIGAFPKLIRFLPKPGVWMETFKQIMGFILLGTVVYLFTLIHWVYVIPTLALLMGIWAACWWIGRTPLYAEFGQKAKAWSTGVVFAAIIGFVSFNELGPIMAKRFDAVITDEMTRRSGAVANEVAADVAVDGRETESSKLPWQPFSKAKLAELAANNTTVVVDFTAKWCWNCQVLKQSVLNTESVKAFVEQNGVIPLVADLDVSKENHDMLEALKGGAIPVLAIFPAGDPNRPIVFRDMYTQQMLLDALAKAGPSKNAAVSAAAISGATAEAELPLVAQRGESAQH